MSLFGDKKPLLVDLDRGIVGTFVGVTQEGVTEPGFVFIDYVPLNGIKTIRYTKPVQKITIHNVYPHADVKGVEKEIVFVYEGTDDSIVKFIDRKQSKLIKELNDRVKDLEIEKATARSQAEDAFAGAEKVVQKQKQLAKTENKGMPDILGGERRNFEEF